MRCQHIIRATNQEKQKRICVIVLQKSIRARCYFLLKHISAKWKSPTPPHHCATACNLKYHVTGCVPMSKLCPFPSLNDDEINVFCKILWSISIQKASKSSFIPRHLCHSYACCSSELCQLFLLSQSFDFHAPLLSWSVNKWTICSSSSSSR